MKKSVKFLTRSAIIASIYIVLSIALQAFSFGPIQFRVSEILVLTPTLMVEAIPGLTIGCFIANFFFSPYGVFDVIIGTIATLVAATLTYLLRKKIILSALPPIILNALLVPIVYIIDNSGIYYIAMLEILTSELISVLIIGAPLTTLLRNSFIKARIITPIPSKFDSIPYYKEDEDSKL